MSQQTGRRAALGAAVVGVLLALVSAVTGVAPHAAAGAADRGSAPSYEAPVSQLGHAVLRGGHASVATHVGADRTAAGHGTAAVGVALLVLALGCLAVGVRRSRALWSSAVLGARGCRAPPAAVRI